MDEFQLEGEVVAVGDDRDIGGGLPSATIQEIGGATLHLEGLTKARARALAMMMAKGETVVIIRTKEAT